MRSIDQLAHVSGKKSMTEGKDTEEILNLLSTGNGRTKMTLELINNTLSAST